METGFQAQGILFTVLEPWIRKHEQSWMKT